MKKNIENVVYKCVHKILHTSVETRVMHDLFSIGVYKHMI